MGCFSYLCKVCGHQIICDQGQADNVILYHLRKGIIIEQMEGPYDSYGRVSLSDGSSKEWFSPWGVMVDEQYGDDISSGIAAVHKSCYDGRIINTRSDNDPNQGWIVEEEEHEGHVDDPREDDEDDVAYDVFSDPEFIEDCRRQDDVDFDEHGNKFSEEETSAYTNDLEHPKTDITVKLSEGDGNAFYILGLVCSEMRRCGYGNLCEEYKKEAMSGDYDNLLITTMKYVNIE